MNFFRSCSAGAFDKKPGKVVPQGLWAITASEGVAAEFTLNSVKTWHRPLFCNAQEEEFRRHF
jgi:hypothetical protein